MGNDSEPPVSRLRPPSLVPEFCTLSFLFFHSFFRPYPQTVHHPLLASSVVFHLNTHSCLGPVLSPDLLLCPPVLPSASAFPSPYQLLAPKRISTLLLLPPSLRPLHLSVSFPFSHLSPALGSRSLGSLRAFSNLPTLEKQATASR